ncbi:MAG TPA: ATP-binding protein [Fervidobacterium sp.]|nr:ATP-binding protein [Fervidobacterium sp.]HPT54408.1 ATP-binding protein [Fervidobacterium sp.]HPZ17748.1 ATP-binding protein [Fervidobacterium sp.]HQE49065.1 ATP-binding protein [Fervidobacterium sp.]HUM42901.1 ATP-binding protein [Fervidobacterium sp.]
MFIGREKELKDLEKFYGENKFQFVVVYGRRRVGKTTLLSKFCQGKPSLFFTADESIDSISLERFSKMIFSRYALSGLSSFNSWEDAFTFVGQKAKDDKLILVIDEFQYLVNANKSIPSILQRLIDHQLVNTKLFLVLCGSYVSFMEEEVLGCKSPLYGRRTAQFEIVPLDFFDSRKFFPRYDLQSQVMTYGILGGTPQYLSIFDESVDVFENVERECLQKSSYLYEEPIFLLHQELREPSTYNSILSAIAHGNTRLNKISTRLKIDDTKVSKYINTLIGLKLVERLKPEPIGRIGRESIFKIKDDFFRFWYRFIFENRTLIDQDLGHFVANNLIKPSINEYMGEVFEDVSSEFLEKMNTQNRVPFTFKKIGKWWGNNPLKKREEEIDIVAYDEENILLGECKWWNEIVDISVLNTLIEKGVLFDFKNKYYAIFSKSGFTKKVMEFAKVNGKILLFTVEDFAQNF